METTQDSVPEIDIVHRDCLTKYDSVACTRNVVLCVLSGITAFMCVVKVIRLHMQHSGDYHHFLVFYLATISCCAGGINWVLGGMVQMHLALHFLKLLMFLVLLHFYWVLAFRSLRCEAGISQRVLYGSLGMVLVTCLCMAAAGMASMTPDANDCMEIYWLLMSLVEIALVQFCAIAAHYISRRLNGISTLVSVRWSQKRDLWCIVIVLEFSALATLIYDITIQILGDKETGCGAIFNYQQSLYTPIYGSRMVIKLLLPIWVMLYAFQPNSVGEQQDTSYPAYSEDGTYGSGFSDDSHYRQLYHPTDMYYSVNHFLPEFSPSPGSVDPHLGLSNPALNSSGKLQPISEEGSMQESKDSFAKLAAARNIPKDTGQNKCFNWLTSPSPAKIYL